MQDKHLRVSIKRRRCFPKKPYVFSEKVFGMKSVHTYKFYKTKYGEELLVDVVSLDSIRKYVDQYPVHSLSYFDITFITGGSGRFSLDNRSYELVEGDVLFSKPGEIRSWDTMPIPHGYALIFEEEFLLSFFNDPSFLQNLSYFRRERPSAHLNIGCMQARIDSLLQSIRDEINNEQSKDKHILRALLYEMLMLLNRAYTAGQTPLPSPVRNRYIDDFLLLADRHFKTRHDTTYYAGQLCITPNYLNEIVRNSIGMTPKRYLQNKIIQEAKRLLSYTTLSVAEITDELNFESPSYLIRLFRQETGLTPLQYRRQTNR